MPIIKDLSDLVYHYSGKPVDFIYDLILTPKQRLDKQIEEVAEEFEAHRFVAVSSGHATCKTSLEAQFSLYLMTTKYRPLIATTAPTKRQLDIGYMPALKMWYNQSLLKKLNLFNWQKTTFEINNPDEAELWRVIPFSASEPDNVAGLHSPTMAYLIDEAPGVNTELFPVIDGALTSGDIYFGMFGQPTCNEGYFYDTHHDPKIMKKFKQFYLSSEKSSQVTKVWINDMKDKYGEDSNIYKIRVLGQFSKELQNGYIKLHLIERAYHREAEKTEKAFHGLDPGGSENGDPTAMISRIGYQMTEKNKWFEQDHMKLIPEIRTILNKYKNKENFIIMDRTGIGHGLWNRLTELSNSTDPDEKINATIIGLHFGEKATEDADIFNGVRTQVWENMNNLLLEGKPGIIDDPNDKSLEFELTNRLMNVKKNCKMEIESKDDYKARTGKKSPNDADACNLCFFESITNETEVATSGDIDDDYE